MYMGKQCDVFSHGRFLRVEARAAALALHYNE